jgi:hypothetical protein
MYCHVRSTCDAAKKEKQNTKRKTDAHNAGATFLYTQSHSGFIKSFSQGSQGNQQQPLSVNSPRLHAKWFQPHILSSHARATAAWQECGMTHRCWASALVCMSMALLGSTEWCASHSLITCTYHIRGLRCWC